MKQSNLSKVAVVMLLCFSLSACNDAYGTAAKGSADVAASIGQAENDVDQLRINGVISASEEKSILGYLNFANTLNGQFQSCAKAVHSANRGAAPQAYMGCVGTFSSGLASPSELAAIHVSSVQGQQRVTLIVQSIQAAVSGVNTALASINAGKSGGQ